MNTTKDSSAYSDEFYDSQISDLGRFSVIITGKTGVLNSELVAG